MMRVDRSFSRLADHVNSMSLKSKRARARVLKHVRMKFRQRTKAKYIYRQRIQLQRILKKLNKVDYSILQKVQH